MSSLLVEGGATLAAALLAHGLIDRLALFVAPLVLGDGPVLLAGWRRPTCGWARRPLDADAPPGRPGYLLVAECARSEEERRCSPGS